MALEPGSNSETEPKKQAASAIRQLADPAKLAELRRLGFVLDCFGLDYPIEQFTPAKPVRQANYFFVEPATAKVADTMAILVLLTVRF